MHALLASNGQEVVLILSRKPIATARRKLLRAELAAGGSIKYFSGTCRIEANTTTFARQADLAGLAKKIRVALLRQTGMRVKVRCRDAEGASDDDGEPADATQPQTDAAALSRLIEAIDLARAEALVRHEK